MPKAAPSKRGKMNESKVFINWRVCELCRKVKIPKGRQRFCGSKRMKTGCSWIMQGKYHREAVKRWAKKNIEKERVRGRLKGRRYAKRQKENPRKTIVMYGRTYKLV